MQEQILECLECWVELGLLSSESPHPLVSCSDHRWLCCSVRMCQLEISRPGSSWRCRRGNSRSSEVQIWSRGHQTGARMWLKTNQRFSIVLCQPIRDYHCFMSTNQRLALFCVIQSKISIELFHPIRSEYLPGTWSLCTYEPRRSCSCSPASSQSSPTSRTGFLHTSYTWLVPAAAAHPR